MLNRTLLIATIGFSLTLSAAADPARTWITGTGDTKAVYENVNTGPMRTTLTRENKYPEVGQVEVGAFYESVELSDMLEQDRYGVYGRIGVAEFLTVGVEVPVVDAEYLGESNTGLGDIVLSLDLLAYQDIFQYPFIIPHVDISLETGDEEEGLGTGETVVTAGISIGTKVYDALTYVLDLAYAFNGGGVSAGNDGAFMLSGSLVWDISDRFAVLAEGRFYEENDFDNNPYQVKGGLVYRATPDVQIAIYAGTAEDETDFSDDQYDLAEARLSVQF